MINVIKKLNLLLSKREKNFLYLLFIFSILVSFLETFSISLVMVFASIATNFDVIYTNKYYNYLYNFLKCESGPNFVVLFGVLLILFYIFRAIIITIFTYASNRFSYGRFRHFATRFFNNYLNFEYKEFTNKNASKLSKVIISDSSDLTQVIDAVLQIFSEGLNVAFIYCALLFAHFKLTLVLSFLLIIKILLIAKFFSERIKKAGKERHDFNVNVSRTYADSFWNFKIIKLFNTQTIINKKFDKNCSELVNVNTLHAILQTFPRLILETVGFSSLIAVIIYVVYMYHNATAIIPLVSMYAFAFYRFLPAINKILASYNRLVFFRHTLDAVGEYLYIKQENLGDKNINFNKNIILNNLSFEYDSKSKILNNINLEIKKNEHIAFIGQSGAGKSTIVDIIMGLYKPISGDIFIDGQLLDSSNIKSWRQKIGYIPQNIYLFDGTVADNVVFGRTFNEQKVINVLQKANIYNFLLTKEGINTLVGDGGILLSGGQKQRIAIARALYSDPEILILDEATSALDNNTEQAIMHEIYNLNENKTLIIIAHRLTTVERCDKIYKIEDGNIYYENVFRDRPVFYSE